MSTMSISRIIVQSDAKKMMTSPSRVAQYQRVASGFSKDAKDDAHKCTVQVECQAGVTVRQMFLLISVKTLTQHVSRTPPTGSSCVDDHVTDSLSPQMSGALILYHVEVRGANPAYVTAK